MDLRKVFEFYKGKKVLVTGHTGFKGAWLCRILINAGAEVTGYSLEPPTVPDLFSMAGLEGRMDSVIGDIRDLDHLKRTFEKAQPELVLHLAAQPIVRDSYKDPVYTYETNVMGTVNILECVRLFPCVRSFLNVTTDKVYENMEWEYGYRENDRLDGYDPYSNSKSCSELVTHSYKKSFFEDGRCAISTCRAGNVIGGGDFANDRIIPDCVRAAMKKGMLPGQLLLAGLSVMQLMMLGWQLWESPVRFLSRPATAYMIPVWFLVLCAVLCELWGFLAWTRRAEKEAENGRFYGLRGNRRLSLALALLALFLSGLILCQMSGGPWGTAWLAVVLGGIMAMTGAVIYIRERMKKRGASRKKNLFFTIGLTVIMSFCFVVALTAMVSSVGITKRSRPVGTYDKGGWEMEVYDDPIPLEMKDLRDAGCDQWSTMADRAETIFLAHTEYSQQPLTTDQSVPDLRYEVTEVKAGFLYGFLKKRLLWEQQDVVTDQKVVMAYHYKPVDPAPWKALDAYRVYWRDSYLNVYLVFYEDRILEIRFGWEPSKWQMAAAAEKLAGKVEEGKK